MLIRNYHPSDQESIMELLGLNTPQYFAYSEKKDLMDFLEHHIDRYYVAELNGKILACGGFNLTEDGQTARISWDIVHPESQGKGVGGELMRFRIQKITKIESVQMISVRTSQLAFQFYERFGFEIKEIVKNYWAEGFDLYRMEMKA